MTKILSALPLRFAVIEVVDVTVSDDPRAFAALSHRAEEYYQQYAQQGQDSPGDVPGVATARKMFRALGVDPTKTRPSSEALLRRALKGKPLYKINSLVDVGNWCSLDYLLPLGLYNRDKLDGSVVIRQGYEAEEYEGIGNRTIHVHHRYVLADDAGPFGSPVADSLRTAITEATCNAIMIIMAPWEYDQDRLHTHAQTSAERILSICGGRATRVELLEADAGAEK